jgi:DNA-binding CsgD family transcriptional regulator
MWCGTPSSRLAAASRIHELADLRAGSGTPLSASQAAAEILKALAEVVPFDCAVIAAWDPYEGSHTTLASVGYPTEALRTFEGLSHAVSPRLPRARNVKRLSDIPVADRAGPVFADVIEPLALFDGISLCLASLDRCVGAIHYSVAGSTRVDDDAIAILALLAPDLTKIVDVLPPHVAALLSHGAIDESVGLLAWEPGTGKVAALNASARPGLVEPSSPLREALVALGPRANRQITVLAGRELLQVDITNRGGWCLLEHRRGVPQAGLSIRELEVLSEVAKGRSNRQVAAALAVSERTIVSHVEHILIKLAVPNRTAAAVEAARSGLLRLRPGRWSRPASSLTS